MWIVLLLGIFLLSYLYVKKKFTFFSKHGVPHQPGTFPLGSDVIWKILTGKLGLMQPQEVIYKEFPDAKIAGYYGVFGSPIVFVIRDMELIKRILVKDFDHFMDRRHIGKDQLLPKFVFTFFFQKINKAHYIHVQRHY